MVIIVGVNSYASASESTARSSEATDIPWSKRSREPEGRTVMDDLSDVVRSVRKTGAFPYSG